MDRIVFSGGTLDRASNRRRDTGWLASQLESESSRFLPFWRLQVLVKESDVPELAWARSELREHARPGSEPVLLGLRDEVAHFALDISPLEKPVPALGLSGVARFSEVRGVATQLSPEDAAVVAQARALVNWHARHGFCSVCGSKTTAHEGGMMRDCDECDTEHFPRTDPVVIMVVHDGERCLLGRQAAWPGRTFSALAGFVEPGETLEEAVRREVHEETNVRVGAVRYWACQPWPFPSSLMIGCHGRAESVDIVVDRHELAEARWFSREEIAKALAEPGPDRELFVPPPLAIAHHLIKAWSEGAEA